jgi:DNA-binding transcriptional ArsR family regulator
MSDTEPVSRDLVFSILSNSRRRLTIRYLRSVEGPVTVRELSREVAALENEIDPDELSYKQRKRVYTSLHQTHLPKLDDAEFVTYDRDRGEVSLRPRIELLYPHLDPPAPPAADWTRVYLALAGVSVALVLAAALGAPGFTSVPGLAYAAVIAAAFGAVTVARHYRASGGTERRANAEAVVGPRVAGPVVGDDQSGD